METHHLQSDSNLVIVRMKFFAFSVFTTLLSELSCLVAGESVSIPLPPGLPRSVQEFRRKHPYEPSTSGFGERRVVTIRQSVNDTDDVSADFKNALEHANHGGTLYLPANQTFVIGQPLDLTFLSDVHVRLDGEILFTNDTSYWQSVAFTRKSNPPPNSLYPTANAHLSSKTLSKTPLCFGNGAETRSRSTAMEC